MNLNPFFIIQFFSSLFNLKFLVSNEFFFSARHKTFGFFGHCVELPLHYDLARVSSTEKKNLFALRRNLDVQVVLYVAL